ICDRLAGGPGASAFGRDAQSAREHSSGVRLPSVVAGSAVGWAWRTVQPELSRAKPRVLCFRSAGVELVAGGVSRGADPESRQFRYRVRQSVSFRDVLCSVWGCPVAFWGVVSKGPQLALAGCE